MRRYHLICFLATLSACGQQNEVEPTFPPLLGRCDRDGLCIVREDDQVLSVGYREGARQVAFDAVRGTLDPIEKMKGGHNVCRRMVWGGGHTAWSELSSSCPRDWTLRDGTHDPAQTNGYPEMMPRMADAMEKQAVAPAWRATWARAIDRLGAWRNAPNVSVVEADDDLYRRPMPQPTSLTHPDRIRVTDASLGRTDTLDVMLGGSLSPGKFDTKPQHGKDSPGVIHRRRVDGNGVSRYLQVIDLWHQPVRDMLVFGNNSGDASHTGTVASVYVNENVLLSDDWQLVEMVISRNHGAEPGYGDMEQYDSCMGGHDHRHVRSRPYYIVGGCMEEYNGTWPAHLCNDDAALQMMHAEGIDEKSKQFKRDFGHGILRAGQYNTDGKWEMRMHGPQQCNYNLIYQRGSDGILLLN